MLFLQFGAWLGRTYPHFEQRAARGGGGEASFHFGSSFSSSSSCSPAENPLIPSFVDISPPCDPRLKDSLLVPPWQSDSKDI
jgi:hypothetical protein